MPIVRLVCQLAVEPDGVVFDVESLQAGDQGRRRLRGCARDVQASLDKALVRMQLDLGLATS